MQTLTKSLIPSLLICLLLAGCVSPPKYPGRSVIDHHPDVLRGEALFPADEPLPELAPVQLISVNDDMRAFLDQVLGGRRLSDEFTSKAILRALLDDGLRLRYNNLKTYTAEEAFYAREGNCMSFTNLFIALAREAGVAASFQEVRVPPTWSAIGDMHFYYLHINSIVDYASGKQVVVDFDTRADLSRGRAQHVSDRTAAAQYYNNMAVFYLGEGSLREAFLHARKAILLRPATGYFWSNLGTILKRAGDYANAEQAYLAAIDLDGEPSAVSNLARLYSILGKQELAREYTDRAEGYRMRNPYYLYQLAEVAYNEGDYQETQRLLRSAIRKHREEHRFHRLMGLSWAQLGDAGRAKKSFAKAAKYATEPQHASLYRRKILALGGDI